MSPIVARWELSKRLVARRKELDITVETITKALGFSRNYFSAVERDRTLIAADKLPLLAEVLKFDDDELAELLELREAGRVRGWWERYSMLDETTQRFIGLENGASRIRAYEGLLIPGLLQTTDYSRAVIERDPSFSQVHVDEVLDVRKERQKILESDSATLFSVLLSQAALLQYVHGPKVQRNQLEHLIHLIEDRGDLLQVRVLPFEKNPGIIANSSTLVLLDFDREQLPEIAYQESVRSLDFIEGGNPAFLRVEFAWTEARSRSLDRPTSLALIQQVATSMG